MTSIGDLSPLLTYFDQFGRLSVEAREAIEHISSVVSVQKNKDLQPIGHTCKTIYLVKKGAARIHYFKDANDITESFAFENHLIVRVESLFTGQPSKKAIQALEDTEFIAVKAQPLFDLYDRFPEIERLFRKIFEAAHVETVRRLESIQFHTAEERYKDLLNEAPEIVQRIAMKHIASYLGINRVSLSRIRSFR